MRLRTTLALTAALCSALLPAATAHADTPSAKTYTVWQWNVAGDSIHDGSTTDKLVTEATASIEYRKADFAGFNELCQNQYDEIVKQLRADGWPEDPQNFARFAPSRAAGNPAVCQGNAFGNAVFSKKPLGSADRLTLPSDGTTEDRNLLCAPLTDGSRTRFCTTHITTKIDFSASQLDYVRGKLDGYHTAGDTVLIAGDFNAQPNYGRLNSFYAPSANTVNNPNNTGAFRELDDNDAAHCAGYGERTTQTSAATPPPCGTEAKIDLIFVRESDLAGPYSADSLAISTECTGVSACSDHRILTGTVTVTA
ncbi:endonuclease/exonuclease/phosphatase family protein [Streptomyces sp. 4.24]|uniref:endonuclease/exonuclease/phosphatase family protein n=1 Tax=Streptomyces tritrimontium TaxID=3406573 RepID=UPI003BB815CB